MSFPSSPNANVMPLWPASIAGSDGISVERDGLTANISFRPGVFGEVSSVPETSDVLVYDPDNGATSRLPIATFVDLPLAQLAVSTDPTKGAGLIGINGETLQAYTGVNTKAELLAALNQSGVVFLADKCNIIINDENTVSGRDFYIFGGKRSRITFTSTGSLSFNGYLKRMENVEFVGPLTNEIGFTEAITGSTISTAFDSATYSDGSSTINGADFTHTKVGSVLTVSLDSTFAFSAATRLVVSDYITLNPAKRYVVWTRKGATGGQGNNEPIFTLYDGSHTLIGTHSPHDTSSYYSKIEGASYLKISVGMFRFTHTATGLSCTYDFSKFSIYECVNDLAPEATDLAAPPENFTRIQVSNSDSPIIRGCKFLRMDGAAMKIINGNDALVENNLVQFCYGGFTCQNDTGTRFLRNTIDLRYRLTGGGYLGQLMMRNHGVSSYQSTDLLCAFNVIKGASWGMEIILNSSTKYARATDNRIDCVRTGISLVSGGGAGDYCNEITRNTIMMSAFGSYGIECSTAAAYAYKAVVMDNYVDVLDFTGNGVAMAFGGSASADIKVLVKGGHYRAPTGLSLLGTTLTGELVMEDVNIVFGQHGIWSRAYQTKLRRCRVRLERNVLLFGTEMQAALRIEPPTNGVSHFIEDCEFDQTATYTGYLATVTNLFMRRNRHPYGGVAYANRVGEYRFGIISSALNIPTKFYINDNEFELSNVNLLTTTAPTPALYSGSVIALTGNRYQGQEFNFSSGFTSTIPFTQTGTGTPEGAVSAPIGSMFIRTDGGTGTSRYFKESGTGDTGWVAK